jgi:hypothetical protein
MTAKAFSVKSVPVNFSAVSDLYDFDSPCLVVHSVDDPVISLANSMLFLLIMRC